jgi:hypothetical protein
MGTRAVVARWVGDEAWIGRYVHYDGYPANMVMRLLEIILRDGFNDATSKLVFESNGWSGLYDEPHKDFKTNEPDLEDYVPGYGYLLGGNALTSNDWITWESDNWGTEWCYILDPVSRSVTILEYSYPEIGKSKDAYRKGKWLKYDVVDFGPAIDRVCANETTIEDEVSRRWQNLSVLEGVV